VRKYLITLRLLRSEVSRGAGLRAQNLAATIRLAIRSKGQYKQVSPDKRAQEIVIHRLRLAAGHTKRSLLASRRTAGARHLGWCQVRRCRIMQL
jgi:hypothetical protein